MAEDARRRARGRREEKRRAFGAAPLEVSVRVGASVPEDALVEGHEPDAPEPAADDDLQAIF